MSWPELAPWYDELLESGSGPHETALDSLRRLLPDVRGASVLDVACGQGLATRAVAEAGAAAVVGVDSAPPMLEIAARRTPVELAITWRVDDAERLETCAPASFDGVTCQLALMDIGDLGAALRSMRRVLRPGGWLVFVIGHPCFLAPFASTQRTEDGRSGRLVARYFEHEFWRSANPDGIRGRAGNHHRPLSAYLNALAEAGFRLDAADEPRATPLLAEQQPVYVNVPIFFSARAQAPT